MTFLSFFIPRQHHHFAVGFAVSLFHFPKVGINPTSFFAIFSFGFDDVIVVFCVLNVHTFSSCNSIYWNASQFLCCCRKMTYEKCFLWFVTRKRFVFIHSNPSVPSVYSFNWKTTKWKMSFRSKNVKIEQGMLGSLKMAILLHFFFCWWMRFCWTNIETEACKSFGL